MVRSQEGTEVGDRKSEDRDPQTRLPLRARQPAKARRPGARAGKLHGLIATPVEHPEGARFNWAGKKAQNTQKYYLTPVPFREATGHRMAASSTPNSGIYALLRQAGRAQTGNTSRTLRPSFVPCEFTQKPPEWAWPFQFYLFFLGYATRPICHYAFAD